MNIKIFTKEITGLNVKGIRGSLETSEHTALIMKKKRKQESYLPLTGRVVVPFKEIKQISI